MATHALDRHVALVGFMGAGKSTLAPQVAERLGRRVVDVDRELGVDIPALFAQGEDAFRAVEERRTCDLLGDAEPAVLALGGGSVTSAAVRDALASRALTVLIDVDVDTAWERVQATDRPLGQDETAFRRLRDERRPVYGEVADAIATDADGVILAAAGIHVETGALQTLERFVDEPAALVTEPVVAGIHGADAQLAFPFEESHDLPTGEAAKQLDVVEQLWRSLRLDRDGTVVALGGGSLTDAAGFAAATYLRGIRWVPVPSTLTGQVDAAIGGKTAIDLPEGKNLVGAFHWPARTVIDPALLASLPERERKNGLAEVVKTGLLAGETLWDLPDPELVRRCAAFKAAVCLRDPHDRGERKMLNLGHTFAHALEAGARFALPHGEAVALGLLAALRLSDLDTDQVEEVLTPKPVRADRERAWEALGRDKKSAEGGARLVLLDAPGRPRVDVELPDQQVRAELDRLIAD